MLSITLNFGTGFLTGSLVTTLCLALAVSRFLTKWWNEPVNASSSANGKTISQRERLRTAFVDSIANLVADVIDHPRVDEAMSDAIANGITTFLASPGANEAINAVVSSSEHRSDVIKQIGKELPGMAKDFTRGLVSNMRPRWEKDKRKRVDKATGSGELSSSLSSDDKRMVEAKLVEESTDLASYCKKKTTMAGEKQLKRA